MKRARSVSSSAPSLILVMAVASALFTSQGCSVVSEIVLVVDTDLAVPAELDAIEITVTGPSGPLVAIPPLVDLPNHPFPRTLGLVDKGKSSAVVVQVIGRHGTDQVAVQEVHTSFVDGEKRMLRVVLSAACLGSSCAADSETCELGRCVPTPNTRSGDSLPVFDGPLPSRPDRGATVVDNRALWATGWRSCATQGSNLYCWGDNTNGQVGIDPATNPVFTRVRVPGLPDGPLKSIGLGYYHSCVCDKSGQVWCWGLNDFGQVLPGGPKMQTTPVLVPGVKDCVQIVGGFSHTCAVVSGAAGVGTVWCWGRNDSGQTGQPGSSVMTPPQMVVGLSGVVLLQAGDRFNCALSTGSAVQCWGDNGHGQLGDGSGAAESSSPTKVARLPTSRPASLALGRNFACVMFSTGQVSCWGENSDGMIGIPGGAGMAVSSPTLVPGIANATQIAAGHQHACVLRNTGVVSCWGNGQYGQLGNSTGPVMAVVDAANIGEVAWLAVGDQHSCARATTGTVYCWGQNIIGQLGIGPTSNQLVPVEVAGF